MREEKTFRVVVFRFETDASTNYTSMSYRLKARPPIIHGI